jgi:hypothetical protein
MPSYNKFDFYQRAYAINQAWGTSSIGTYSIGIATSSIRMGDGSPFHGGFTSSLAEYISETYTTYDVLSTEENYKLNNEGNGSSPEHYSTKFTTTAPNDQQAAYLSNTFVGKPVPKVNQAHIRDWDQTCYPSALGDIRDNTLYNNERDGAWVEAGLDPHPGGFRNTINIYRIDVSSSDPYFMATANVSVTSGSPCPTQNCRVFTSPGFIEDNVSSSGNSGYPLIAFFAWDGTNTYYELFSWDIVNNTINSIRNYNLTSVNGANPYLEFPYSGKHDIFYLSKWAAPQSYTSRDYLLIVAGGSTSGNVWQLNLFNGNLSFIKGDAANYSDFNDVILIAQNGSSGEFSTYLSDLNSAPVEVEVVTDLNVFDIDYNWLLGTDYFFIGDDQQALIPPIIKGWFIYINPSGSFNSSTFPTPTYLSPGIYYKQNRIYSLTSLKRAVAVDFGRIWVGSGPGLGTQSLISISCIDDGGYGTNSFYRTASYAKLLTGTENEDFVAMNHGFCEDWTGYFDPSGIYQTYPDLNYGLPVGAGNQNILGVKSSMDVYAFQKNFFGPYHNSPLGSSYSDNFNYIIYLGQAPYDPAAGGNHTGKAWIYIAVTGGPASADFLIPGSTPNTQAAFSGTLNGKIQILFFYA